jgi:hypothetical protein
MDRSPQYYGAIFAIALFAFSVFVGILSSIRRYNRKHIFTFLRCTSVGLFSSAAVLIGYMYFYGIGENGADIFTGNKFQTSLAALQHTIRVFAFDDGYSELVGRMSEWQEAERTIYERCAAVLYVFAPITTITFVLTFVKNLFSHIRYWFHRLLVWQDIHVFSELNDKTLALANSFIEGKTSPKAENRLIKWFVRSFKYMVFRPTIIFTDVTDKTNEENTELVVMAREMGAILFRKDLESIRYGKWHIRKNRLNFYLISEDEEEKIRHAAHVIEEYGRVSARLYLFSDTTEAKCFIESYSEDEKSKMRMEVMRVNDIRALIYHDLDENGIQLFQNAQKAEGEKREINAVIVGLGKYGTEMLKALLWYCRIPGFKVNIKAFDEKQEVCERVANMFPSLEVHLKGENISEDKICSDEDFYRIEIERITASTKSLYDKIDQKTTFVFICLGSDELNLTSAIEMRVALRRKGCNNAIVKTVVYDSDVKSRICSEKNEDLYEMEEGQGVHIIGDMNSFYSQDVVISQDTFIGRGLEVHGIWEKTLGVAGKNKFYMNDYNFFSSVAKALHISLRSKILEYEQNNSSAAAAVFPELFSGSKNAEKNKEFFVNTSSVSGAANFAYPFTEFCNVLYTKLSKMRYNGFLEAQKAACIEKMLSDADKNGADGGEAKKKAIKEALDNFDNLSKDDLGKLDKLFSAVVATLAESDMKGTPKKAIRSSISLDKLSPEAQKEVLEFVGKYSKENIDKVREVSSVASYIEHARWEMYMASEGYIYGDSTVKPLKMHSNMVTTEYLTLGDSIKDI